MKAFLAVIKTLLLILAVVLLTIITQIGGLVLLIIISIAYPSRKRWKRLYKPLPITGMFVLLYLLATLILVPMIAPLFGRTALPCYSGSLRPLNVVTCLCNRHYVVPQLKAVALDAAAQMEEGHGVEHLYYLDANFPFVDGFPLVPHLSHNDGKKLDLAFYYKSTDGQPLDGTPSPIGYGVFEDPRDGEPNKPEECARSGQWQYGFMQRIIPQGKKQTMPLDEGRTQAMLLFFCKDERVGKMFLEPHLKSRLGLNGYGKVRYQGCHSVRHDDHVHIQL